MPETEVLVAQAPELPAVLQQFAQRTAPDVGLVSAHAAAVERLRERETELARLRRACEGAKARSAALEPLHKARLDRNIQTLIGFFADASAPGQSVTPTDKELAALTTERETVVRAVTILDLHTVPAGERGACYAQADVLSTLAAMFQDSYLRSDSLRTDLLSLAAVREGGITVTGGGLTERLGRIAGELLAAAITLRQKTQEYDQQAAAGVAHASSYDPALIENWRRRIVAELTKLPEVTNTESQGAKHE